MLKLLKQDTTGSVPYPEVSNPMLDRLKGLMTQGGYSLEGDFPNLILHADDGYETPPGLSDFFSVGLLKIVSAKLKATLQLVGAELEYFPVTIMYRGKKTATQYFVGNPLKRVKGIDMTLSDVDLDDELGDAISVRKLVLDESQFEGIKFAMVDELQRIAVADEVCQAIRNAGCTGCMFVEAASIRY